MDHKENRIGKTVSIILPDLSGGGAERLYVYLANEWAQQGYLVSFVLMQKKGDLIPLVSPEINIINLKVYRIRNVILPLSKQIKILCPDIIITAMWPLTSITVVAWLLAGKKPRLYLTEHVQLSISCVEEIKVPLYIAKLFIRLTYPLATGVITVSEGVKDDLLKLSKLPKDKIQVIYNPAATGVESYRESKDVREKLWGAGFEYHILTAGTLKTQKDHENLLQAFKLLPSKLNVKLTILGDGHLREYLTKLIIEYDLKDRVSMPGFVIDPYPWFRSADLFVLSSRWEGFGNVIVEALECGVPVVSTDCPSGPAEILNDARYGKLVPVSDSKKLAIAIEESLGETPDRELLKNRAQDFTVKNISNQYMDFCFD